MPCAASTTSSAPSHACSERETSYVKSTWPGVSIRLSWCFFHETRTACALIVIPRSRSRSIESSSCARMSRLATACVCSRMRSASVDLPWSMCAMIEKLRMWFWSITRSAARGAAPDQRQQRLQLTTPEQPEKNGVRKGPRRECEDQGDERGTEIVAERVVHRTPHGVQDNCEDCARDDDARHRSRRLA